jgi:two-component system sensor histidine kinase AlgZ
LIRRDPRRAEAALEDLADLIRVQLADTRRLVPLRDELALCRQYLTIEQMRLGDRLALRWEVDPAAEAALVPPLVLQPLLENAVYHGVEPNVTGGLIELTVRRDAARIQIAVRNPHLAVPTHQSGNRMAMQNIRERLALAFDVEAQLRTEMNETTYLVDVQLPFRTAAEPA